MTNNFIFKRLLTLTKLGYDQDLIVMLFKTQKINVSKSQIRAWRGDLSADARAQEMPDGMLKAFFDALFHLRDKADDKNIALFDCKNIL